MKTSFAKRTALIVLLLVLIGAGAWLLMRSIGTDLRAGPGGDGRTQGSLL